MSLEIGIVGLPNVGKSTLFNALLKAKLAEAANFPFTTIEPNVGIVTVPDERLEKLANVFKPEKVTPTIIKFVDIAGLVSGAHKGEGLGNKFLAHIREVDAIAMVVRFFANPDVVHVAGKIAPEEDISTITLELILADLATVTRRLDVAQSKSKSGDKAAILERGALEKINARLEREEPARAAELNEEEKRFADSLQLLTSKPFIYIANVSEEEIGTGKWELLRHHMIPISAKLEAELAELTQIEQKEYLATLNLKESGLNALIRGAYDALGLITFFTAGPTEVRAWTVERGAKAPRAAGKIHTDFERGFIAAEVIGWETLLAAGGPSTVSSRSSLSDSALSSESKTGQPNYWNEAKTKGLIKTEGKDYVMKDGDVVVFKFNA